MTALERPSCQRRKRMQLHLKAGRSTCRVGLANGNCALGAAWRLTMMRHWTGLEQRS